MTEIIDCHVHLPMGQVQTIPDAESVLEEADDQDITQLWNLGDVLRYGFLPTEEQVEEINDLTLEMIEAFPGKIIGFCFLNPANNQSFLLKEIDRCFKAGFVGIKLEASVNCLEPSVDLIMKQLKKRNGILFQHSWYKSTGNLTNESSPADIARLAKRYPGVPIVMPHLTGIGIRGVLDVADQKNVYIDTSGGQPVNTLLEYAVQHLGEGRILYGSDIPGRDFSCQVGRILGSRISESAKQKILHDNASLLLSSSGKKSNHKKG